MRKTTFALLMILCMSASVMTGAQTSRASGQAATFDERLGDDDGAALAILISANERSNIEVCD